MSVERPWYLQKRSLALLAPMVGMIAGFSTHDGGFGFFIGVLWVVLSIW